MTEKKPDKLSGLYEHQIMYRDLVETSQDLIWQCDSEGRYIYLNQAWATTFGYQVEEMLGRKFFDFQSPEFGARDQKAFESIIQGKRLKGYETTHIGKSGKEIHLVFNAKALFDEQGRAIGALGSAYDITERKLAEQETLQIKTAIDAAGDAIGMSTPDGRHFYQNEAFNRLFGYTLVEVTKAHPVTLYANEDDGRMVFELIMAGRSWHGEMEMVDKNGRRFPVLLRADAIKDDNGKIVGLIGVHTDITERKRAEEAVAAEKERLATTLRSIGDGVITTDTKGIITAINKVAEELTGWTQNESLGKPLGPVFNVMNKITREPCEDPVARILALGKAVDLPEQSLLISRDGTERNIADSGAPIKDKRDNTIGVVLVFRDTTEKQKLLEAAQRADKLDSIGLLAGGIAHDFNNLLSGMFGFIDLARRNSAGNRKIAEYLDNALGVFDRAKDLTRQLLTFSKGGMPLRKPGHLGPFIIKSARFALSGSNVGCTFRIAEDLRPCDFDENQLGCVINNIVINAIQAMPMGGTIEISAENVELQTGDHPSLKAGPYVKVSIADTGVGIHSDIKKYIFDPFFTTKHEGYGLGLTTCYSIMQKHEGLIDVESEPEKGSVFILFIRASTDHPVLEKAPTTLLHEYSGNIVVMDDESFIRDLVGEMLKSMGYNVIKTRNGEETLLFCLDARKNGTPITCAILDLTIPGGMGGRETLEELRKIYPDLPIFASSGYSEDPIMANPNYSGFTDSIRKPYLINELADMLNKHLR
ncbi:MAG: PAS domain S-box protein [Deltaproteobacteria bacterium]|nr:PAS domain S-box protein [Deltaproteobacteria bacterium]